MRRQIRKARLLSPLETLMRPVRGIHRRPRLIRLEVADEG